jgi:hypothetical protein
MNLKPLKPAKKGRKQTVRPLIRKDDKIWSSPGVTNAKPAYCKNNCPLGTVSAGFVRDALPREPRMLVLFPTPGKDDVIFRDAWASGLKKWLTAMARGMGLDRGDIAIAHVLRCYCGADYPTGSHVKTAEGACRHYDYEHAHNGEAGIGGIADVFDTDLFYVTLDPRKVMGTQALYRLFKLDFERAASFVHLDYRPTLLCGSEVAGLVAPFKLDGGVKDWRGHWWEGSWPFKRGRGTTRGRGFRT